MAVRVIRGVDTATNYAHPTALERNYVRFAALAGVHGEGPAPRGMPEDASDTARLLYITEGNHTPSWLPLAEATEIFVATEQHELSELDKEYPIYHYFGIEHPVKHHRLVFWFDS